MTGKPEISHFSPSDDSTPQRAGDDTDRSKLSQLYPEPKTYAQKEHENKLRQQSYRRRWPRYPYVTIAAYGAILSGIVMWFLQSIGTWWFSSDNKGLVISNVFLSFALGLVVGGLLFAWIHYTNKLFSYFERSPRIFWIIYGAFIGSISTLRLREWMLEFTSILWILIVAALAFLVTFFSSKMILRGVD